MKARIPPSVRGFAGAVLLAGCAGALHRPAAPPPKLIVQIACDQLRGDLLEKYGQALTGGFARVRASGSVYTHATVDHAPSNSYPGHETLGTGVHPRKHGIVDNDWLDTSGQPFLTGGVDDPGHPIVGFEKLTGVSPRYLQVTGLADWVLEADPRARFAAVSTGEYASLLQSGRARGDVYWFSADANQYVTSTYYRDRYPDWVEAFNQGPLRRSLATTEWQLSVPERFRALAEPDRQAWENDGVHTTFPHRYAEEVTGPGGKSPAEWLADSPVIDEATLALASEAVRNLELGQRDSLDYLAIVLSATESVGHHYGPSSLEQMDVIVRLDRALGRFFDQLDRVVGRDRWVVAVTADHGASEVPEDGERGIRVTEPMISKLLLDAEQAAAAGSRETASDRVLPVVAAAPYVGSVIRTSELASSEASSDPFLHYYRNSYFPHRTPIYPLVADQGRPLCVYGLVVRLAPNAVPYFAPSNHGTPYDYDRSVTMMFMGPGVPARRVNEEVHTTDVAPTLAALAGIPTAPNLDGRVIVGDRRTP
jgi:arylsulfatase A-like enzyme